MNEASAYTARCASLEKALGELSFTMDDLRLFLDTHPCDKTALTMYDRARTQRTQLVKRYEETIGPISFYSAGGTCNWNWVEQPWPWEKEE